MVEMTTDASKFVDGYSISTGVIKNKELSYLLATNDELVQQDIPHTRLLFRHKGRWGAKDLEWLACSVTVSRVPSDRTLTLGQLGEVFAAGGGQSREEADVFSASQSPKRGPLREVRALAGGQAYAVGTCRQAYSYLGPDKWVCIDQTAQVPGRDITETSFESIDGFGENEIYTVGWEGEIWKYDGHTWRQIDTPTNLALYKLVCAADGNAYACGQLGLLLRGRHDKWEVIDHGVTSEDFWGLAWFNDRLYVASTNFLYELRKADLNLVDFGDAVPNSCYHLSTADNIMWSIGAKDVVEFDGKAWTTILSL
jgi:hypothetical protein